MPLSWSAAPCFTVGSSVIAAATVSRSEPPCGAAAARHHAGRLSYINPRVPSMVSTMTVHVGSVPTTTGSSRPSETTSTPVQCSSNHCSSVSSATRSMA